MDIRRSGGQYKACFTAKEIASLLVSSFFKSLFSASHLHNEPYDSEAVSEYIKGLAKHSVDSKDYELYIAIQDLYYMFEKDCLFCFNLNTKFILNTSTITNLTDLYKYRSDDWSDVIVLYKNMFYEFQLKRYRGKIISKEIISFVKKKIIDHYSGKENYLIILQPSEHGLIPNDFFKEIHESLKKEATNPGIIAFLFNHDSKEKLLVRVFPNLEQFKLPFDEVNSFVE